MKIYLFLFCLILPIMNAQAMMPYDIHKMVVAKRIDESWFSDSYPHVALLGIYISTDELYPTVAHAPHVMHEDAKDNEPIAGLAKFYSTRSPINRDDQMKIVHFTLPLRIIKGWQEGSVELGKDILVCDQRGIKGETTTFQGKLVALKKSRCLE